MGSEEADALAEHRNLEERQHHHDRERGQEGHQCPLTRQSTILSLTLDEIQNTVCEPGKSFGSMNMDEFLTNIWTVEEGNAMGGGGGGVSQDPDEPKPTPNGHGSPQPLCRQGSLSLPAPLCRKTVDEVWSEIHREQQPPHSHLNQQQQYQSPGNDRRQPTLGEMTLEDFLIKAGVVRERGYGPCSSSPRPLNQHPLHHHQQNQYGLSSGYPMVNERPGYGHMMGMGYGDHQNPASAGIGVYHHPHQGVGVVMDGSGYSGKSSSNGYGGGRVGNGYGAQQQMGVGSPASPVSSDSLGGRLQVGNPGGQWGLDMGVGGGGVGGCGAGGGGSGGGGTRKRILNGPVERVVERRQRRMIKNRESAARSRARKQAYTLELEAELNQLKEQNARLQEEQRRITAKRWQMLLESMAEQSRANAAQRNAKTLRRCSTCFW